MIDEVEAYENKLETELEKIETRDDLVNFVRLLVYGVEKKYFEELTVVDYVEGIYGVVDGLPYLGTNTGVPVPDPPDWRLVGRILHNAFYHS